MTDSISQAKYYQFNFWRLVVPTQTQPLGETFDFKPGDTLPAGVSIDAFEGLSSTLTITPKDFALGRLSDGKFTVEVNVTGQCNTTGATGFIEVAPCDAFCTLTQGFYGSQKGKLAGTGGSTVVKDALAYWSGPNPRDFRINNTGVGQLVTLALNLGLGTDLGGYVLELNKDPGTGAILDTIICTVQAAATEVNGNLQLTETGKACRQIVIPAAVMEALTKYGSKQTTVKNLLDLSNLAIAGKGPGTVNSLLDSLIGAVGSINEGFDECRFTTPCDACQ